MRGVRTDANATPTQAGRCARRETGASGAVGDGEDAVRALERKRARQRADTER